LYASVGASLGGMCSLLSGLLYPQYVSKIITISSCTSPDPTSIALRHLQRKMIMTDPNWNNGDYYEKNVYPKDGMQTASELATLTNRSEMVKKCFGLNRFTKLISLEPSFEIERYLHQDGERFAEKYDPNSLLYLSKAMDLFNLSDNYDNNIQLALKQIKCPILILGARTDILFPIWQQKQLAEGLIEAGNQNVTFYELNSIYGHDTFLLDVNGVSTAMKGFFDVVQLYVEDDDE
ncbi:unnamed protein product, partial [Didymodactylos carnosus]